MTGCDVEGPRENRPARGNEKPREVEAGKSRHRVCLLLETVRAREATRRNSRFIFLRPFAGRSRFGFTYVSLRPTRPRVPDTETRFLRGTIRIGELERRESSERDASSTDDFRVDVCLSVSLSLLPSRRDAHTRARAHARTHAPATLITRPGRQREPRRIMRRVDLFIIRERVSHR